MAKIRVTLDKLRLTEKQIREALLKAGVTKKGDEDDVITRVELLGHAGSSRSDRLSDAMSRVEDAKSEVEQLKDELQEWRDNLPENLQSSSKADELDQSISELEDLESALADAMNNAGNVNLPGMF